ncbi:MAG TPA: hypothetical protein VNN76_11580 [Bacteroidota bacterium]|nr:hypothetical protein [Bacteroidota bacterium]
MRKAWFPLFIASAALVLSGCSASSRLQSSKGNKYKYKYVMVSPRQSDKLLFRDDRIAILFRFEDSAIRYQLQNLSTTDLHVDFTKASIGVKGRFYSVLNNHSLYVKTSDAVAMPTIPPGGYTVDILIPAEKVTFDGQRWIEYDLLPTTDKNSPKRRKAIEKNVGSAVDLVLPIQFGDEVRKYAFRFMVKSVTPISWAKYKPPRRAMPQAPIAAVKSQDHITTAILVTGFLGFSAYMLTQKKAPPSE